MQPLYYRTNSLHRHLEIADDMGIDKSFVINARRRMLTLDLFAIEDEIRKLQIRSSDNPATAVFRKVVLDKKIERRAHIRKQLDTLKQTVSMTDDSQLSEDQIEQARQYPIEKLIDFNRGKAIAFCHDDKNPSLYHARRTNRANCPVCDRSFNPVDVLMIRDGMSFASAVRNLL